MTSPTQLVRDFCAAWEKAAGEHADLDAVLSFFADDAVYHNMPVDPVVGTDAIRALIETFTAGAQRIEFRVRNIAADGDVVLTERLDVFTRPDRTIELPVMGTFEVRGGKIVAWRDYFDLNQYMAQA